MRWLSDTILWIFSCALWGLLGFGAVLSWVLTNYGSDIPDYNKLKDYQPRVVTRVITGDGQLMAEFATEKRIFVPLQAIPLKVRQAFLSAEDRNFYEHGGIDYVGIGRAMVNNLKSLGSDRRLQGASTITQQVAKNFLLTNEVSFGRKFKEAILAIRMERAMSKDRLLELYLNEIYLGLGAYGVASAAQTYFGKGLDELNVEEMAYLAALPKAPNNYNPLKHKEAAMARRNWVISRMLEDGHITEAEAGDATVRPLQTVLNNVKDMRVSGPYFAEEIRRFLQTKYGSQGLYEDGLTVRATMDPTLQTYAANALRGGLLKYDRRRGYRGPVARFDDTTYWETKLKNTEPPSGMLADWQLAFVLGKGELGLSDGTKIKLPQRDRDWAGANLKAGVVVLVSPQGALDAYEETPLEPERADKKGETPKQWRLRQVPKVQGGLVALDPRTGRVLAMQGGWDYQGSEFNRVTQAQRQVGSAFKPFVYLNALENGYAPNTKVVDGPVSFSMGAGQGVWSPQNYGNDFLGPITLRVALEKSRNLVTVRLAAALGMKNIAQEVEAFGIYDKMDTHLANCLGAQETTLLRMAAAYAMLANGGKKIEPAFIDRIQNRHGTTIYARDAGKCAGCGPLLAWSDGVDVPKIEDTRPQIADERAVYQLVSIMEGVVQRGTATGLKSLNVPLAGKTGTTNESRDTWFIGFTPDLVVGTYIGYDQPKPMGEKETGGRVALPAVKLFLQEALKDRDPTPFRIPPGINLIQVNAKYGFVTTPDDPNAIYEAFQDGEQTDEATAQEPLETAPAESSYGETEAPYDPNAAYDPNRATEDRTFSPPQPSAVSRPEFQGTGGVY